MHAATNVLAPVGKKSWHHWIGKNWAMGQSCPRLRTLACLPVHPEYRWKIFA